MRGGVAVVVQARVGSTRFPGKVLRPFGESTVLQEILRRLSRTRLTVWVATSTSAADDSVETASRTEGISVFRGEEDDVLARFAACLGAMRPRPSLVVRVCADRPFVCPILLGEMLDFYERVGAPDYLSNTLSRSFPDGLDLELVRVERLLEAGSEASDPYEREHVTPFLYRRPDRFRLVGFPCPYGNFASTRAVIDTPADYEALRALERTLTTRDPEFEYRDVLNLATVAPQSFPSPPAF